MVLTPGVSTGGYGKPDPFKITRDTRFKIWAVLKAYDGYHVAVYFPSRSAIYDYKASELVRVKGNSVILSPIAIQLINDYKAKTGQWITLVQNVTFKFNAYSSFFKAILSNQWNAKEYFRRQIVDYYKKELAKHGIKGYVTLNPQDLSLEYNIVGIITGLDPWVKVRARVTLYVDLPALPWYLWATIIVGVLLAVFGAYYTIITVSHETTIQEWYNTLQAYYQAVQQAISHGQPPSSVPAPGKVTPPSKPGVPPSITPTVPPSGSPLDKTLMGIGGIIVLAGIVYLMTRKR